MIFRTLKLLFWGILLQGQFYLILTTLPSFCCLMNLKVKSYLVLTCLGFKPVHIYGTYNKTFHQFKEHSCFFVGNDQLCDKIMVSLSHFFKKILNWKWWLVENCCICSEMWIRRWESICISLCWLRLWPLHWKYQSPLVMIWSATCR